MTENKFGASLDAMFSSMDKLISSKTVVGEAIRVDEHTTILPLVDVSYGLGAGANLNERSDRSLGGGGMGAKMSPSAVLVVQDGSVRLVNVKEQDRLVKFAESLPDMVSSVKGLLKKQPKVDQAVEEAFEGMEV